MQTLCVNDLYIRRFQDSKSDRRIRSDGAATSSQTFHRRTTERLTSLRTFRMEGSAPTQSRLQKDLSRHVYVGSRIKQALEQTRLYRIIGHTVGRNKRFQVRRTTWTSCFTSQGTLADPLVPGNYVCHKSDAHRLPQTDVMPDHARNHLSGL